MEWMLAWQCYNDLFFRVISLKLELVFANGTFFLQSGGCQTVTLAWKATIDHIHTSQL